MNLLDFNFLVILNFLVGLLWPVSTPYRSTNTNVLSIIVTILTVIAVVLDIVFLALKIVH